MTQPTLADWVMEPNQGYGEPDMPPELWAAQTAVEDLRQQFIARRDARRTSVAIPEILYHYTDLRSLHGMFSSLSMWLSDAAYTNDPLEGTWVHKRASDLASEVLGESALAEQTLTQVEAQLSAPDLWDESLRSSIDFSHQHYAAMQEAFRP